MGDWTRSADPDKRADVGGSTTAPLLLVSGLTVRFGGITALDGVSFEVARGQIVGLIGPNGAGKTTLFNCLSRLYPWHAGEIRFSGVSLADVDPHRVAALGIGRTFQNLALFRSMTVRANLLVGGHTHAGGGFARHALRLASVSREEDALDRRAEELIGLLDLREVADMPVASLPFATQKRVELGRALMSAPRLLLLDEPAGGLNHEETEALIGLLRELRSRLDLTMLVVEHHINLVMRVSDRVVVLDFGRKLADSTAAEVQADPEVVRAYLGVGA